MHHHGGFGRVRFGYGFRRFGVFGRPFGRPLFGGYWPLMWYSRWSMYTMIGAPLWMTYPYRRPYWAVEPPAYRVERDETGERFYSSQRSSAEGGLQSAEGLQQAHEQWPMAIFDAAGADVCGKLEKRVGVRQKSQLVSLEEATVAFNVWEVPLHDDYLASRPSSHHSSAAAIVVYDSRDRRSFEAAQRWIIGAEELVAAEEEDARCFTIALVGIITPAVTTQPTITIVSTPPVAPQIATPLPTATPVTHPQTATPIALAPIALASAAPLVTATSVPITAPIPRATPVVVATAVASTPTPPPLAAPAQMATQVGAQEAIAFGEARSSQAGATPILVIEAPLATEADVVDLLRTIGQQVLYRVAERRQTQQAREKAILAVQAELAPEGWFAKVEPSRLLRATQQAEAVGVTKSQLNAAWEALNKEGIHDDARAQERQDAIHAVGAILKPPPFQPVDYAKLHLAIVRVEALGRGKGDDQVVLEAARTALHREACEKVRKELYPGLGLGLVFKCDVAKLQHAVQRAQAVGVSEGDLYEARAKLQDARLG